MKPVKGLWASSDERRLSASGFDYRGGESQAVSRGVGPVIWFCLPPEPAAGEARRPGVGVRQEAEPIQNPPALQGS